MGTYPDITMAQNKLQYSNGGGIADKFLRMAIRFGIPSNSKECQTFMKELNQSKRTLAPLIGNVCKLSVCDADYFKNYNKFSPICIKYVDMSLAVKRTNSPTQRQRYLMPFVEFMDRGFKSVLSYEQAVDLVQKMNPLEVTMHSKSKMLEALKQLKVVRAVYKRLFSFIPKGCANTNAKETVLKLCNDFLDVFAYETVFSSPRY